MKEIAGFFVLPFFSPFQRRRPLLQSKDYEAVLGPLNLDENICVNVLSKLEPPHSMNALGL